MTPTNVMLAPGRRIMAWLALAALLSLVACVCTFVVYSRGLVLVIGLLAGLAVATVAALGWWAFTTRRAWKRRLNVALAALVICLIGLVVATFSLSYALGVAVVAVVAIAYSAACRAAVGGPQAARQPAWVVGSETTTLTRPWLLVNPRSGDGTATRVGLVEVARRRGLEVRVLQPGEDSAHLAREAAAAGADAIGVAGGDGSLSSVAAVAIEYGIPFVCIPAGTRNHFARDLGLDRDAPLTALDAYSGRARLVDVGVVGDRLFLNNVSLGAYASLVHQSGYRANKLATARTMLPSALRVVEDRPTELSYRDSAGRLRTDAVVLLVANNEYDLRPPFDVGSRARLDAGVLQASALLTTTGAGLAVALAGVTTARKARNATILQWTATELSVDGAAAALPVAIDGEAVLLSPPVTFTVSPRALLVLVPNSAAGPVGGAFAFRWLTVRRLWEVAQGRSAY